MSNKIKVQSFAEYFGQFPEDVQEKLHRMRATIQEAAPKATEKISYQMPTFYLHGNLVHFAAYKNHIGFYPTPSAIWLAVHQKRLAMNRLLLVILLTGFMLLSACASDPSVSTPQQPVSIRSTTTPPSTATTFSIPTVRASESPVPEPISTIYNSAIRIIAKYFSLSFARNFDSGF